MSTLTSILVYSTLVLGGLTAAAAAFVFLGLWIAGEADDGEPDGAH